MSSAQLYKLVNLKKLAKCGFESDKLDVKFRERIVFKTLKFCHQLKKFEYKYRNSGWMKNCSTLRLEGEVENDQFQQQKNFKDLFC